MSAIPVFASIASFRRRMNQSMELAGSDDGGSLDFAAG
jgi:hypothetical protein